MTDLKPLKPSPVATKQAFSSAVSAVTRTKTTKENPFKPLSAEESRWIKMMIYGNSGNGKTLALVGLLKAGLKILVINTDFGGNGLNTVINELQRIGRMDLLSNLVSADLNTYEEVETFIEDPESIYPDIYDMNFDMVVWEGMSGFQQFHCAIKVAEIMPERKAGKELSEARESGLQFEQSDWGMVRNATLRPLNTFLNMHNKKTGKKWHKYVTCLQGENEDKTTKDTITGPYLQGASRTLLTPMFDIIVQAKSKIGIGEKDESKRQYFYCCVGHDKLVAKSRGYDLLPVEPADMFQVWNKISKQLVTVNTENASVSLDGN